jgi:hypothetical protein
MSPVRPSATSGDVRHYVSPGDKRTSGVLDPSISIHEPRRRCSGDYLSMSETQSPHLSGRVAITLGDARRENMIQLLLRLFGELNVGGGSILFRPAPAAGPSFGGRGMPAYVVGLHQITDPSKFEEYKTKIGPIVAKYGGRYLTRGENL